METNVPATDHECEDVMLRLMVTCQLPLFIEGRTTKAQNNEAAIAHL